MGFSRCVPVLTEILVISEAPMSTPHCRLGQPGGSWAPEAEAPLRVAASLVRRNISDLNLTPMEL